VPSALAVVGLSMEPAGGYRYDPFLYRNPFKTNLNKITNAFVESDTPCKFTKEIPYKNNSKEQISSEFNSKLGATSVKFEIEN